MHVYARELKDDAPVPSSRSSNGVLTSEQAPGLEKGEDNDRNEEDDRQN